VRLEIDGPLAAGVSLVAALRAYSSMLAACRGVALGYTDGALRRTAMSTVTIVVVGIWNALLLTTLAAAIHWRRRLLKWITQLDRQSRNPWELGSDDRWAAFLAEHPELIDR
jgi:hypothetical protein